MIATDAPATANGPIWEIKVADPLTKEFRTFESSTEFSVDVRGTSCTITPRPPKNADGPLKDMWFARISCEWQAAGQDLQVLTISDGCAAGGKDFKYYGRGTLTVVQGEKRKKPASAFTVDVKCRR